MNNLTQPDPYLAEEQAQHLKPGYLYVVQMDDGSTLFFTNRDRPVTVANLPALMGAADPQTFTPSQITHGAIKNSDRFETSATTIQVTVENTRIQRYLLTAAAVKLKAWIIRIASDLIDAGTVDFETQAVVVQSGILGKFGMSGNQIGIELTPEPFYEEGQIPRFYFGRGCQHFLYAPRFRGVGCGLDKESFKFEATIKALNPAQRIVTLNGQRSPVSPDTYFNAGHFLDVPLNVRMAIAWSAFNGSDTDLKLVTWHPELAVSQAVKAYAGCSHTIQACTAFGNLSNFGGFPFVPNQTPLQGIK